MNTRDWRYQISGILDTFDDKHCDGAVKVLPSIGFELERVNQNLNGVLVAREKMKRNLMIYKAAFALMTLNLLGLARLFLLVHWGV